MVDRGSIGNFVCVPLVTSSVPNSRSATKQALRHTTCQSFTNKSFRHDLI